MIEEVMPEEYKSNPRMAEVKILIMIKFIADICQAGRKEIMLPLMNSESNESKPRGATKNS